MVFFLILSIVELVVIIGGLFLYSQVIKKQKTLVDAAENLVKGKLDIDDVPTSNVKSKFDNTNVISAGVNSIKSNLLTFIEATKQNVVILSDAVETLNNSMKANQYGSEQIANNTIEVDEKTIKQLELVQNNLEVVEESSAQMQEAVAEMEVITKMLEDTSKVSNSGMINLEGYAKDMEIVSADLNAINETLNKFNDDIKRVSEVGDFIIGISGQLKLLSFNASIEAARAGQAGRGFAVVADEMTAMSEQTKEGMDRITSILSEIQESSEGVAKSINKCSDTYENSKAAFEEVNKSFREINDHATQIQGRISDINDMFGVVAQNSEKSREVAEVLHETATEINEKTSEIAGVSQEVTAESIQIGTNVEALSGMVDSIRRMLKRFNTGAVPTTNVPEKTVKIAFITVYDNDFWYGVGRGATYAIKELEDCDVHVEYIPLVATDEKSTDDIAIENVKRVIEEGYDGIIYPGFMSAIEFLITRAKDEGMKIMTFNCDSQNRMIREACLSSNAISQGETAAKVTADILEKKGKVVILQGDTKVLSNDERNKGFRNYIRGIKDVNIAEEIMVLDDPDDIYNKTLEALNNDSSIDAFFLTTGHLKHAAQAIVDAGAAGKTRIVGFDYNQELVPYIQSGVIATVIDQDSFGQGHDPIVYMYNRIVDNVPYPSEYINARSSIIDSRNVGDLL